MNLTDEVLEAWEADARRGCTDATRANARITRLIAEIREDAETLGELTRKLAERDPLFADRLDIALGRAA